MFENKKTRRIVYAVVVGVLATLLIVLTVLLIDARNSATLDIMVAPLSAELTIDGKKYENGKYSMEPGEVSYELAKEGFVTKSGVINLEEGKTVKLYTYLLPEDGSYEWYVEHPEDRMVLNTIGDAIANENSLQYVAKYPIINVLPIIYADYDDDWNYTEYRIDGGSFEECEKEFCMKITDTTGGNEDAALEKIREAGFNSGDYEIIYKYEPIVPLE